MADLRAVVVVDYQNVHLVGHSLFDSTRHLARHETLVDPLLYGAALVRARNAAQRPGMDAAVLRKVLVYRGLPAPEHDADGYARNLAQRSHWERDERVEVTLRPLKYEYQRAPDGRPSTDADGRRVVTGVKEKGIDVLCALALVREAQDPATDVVVLASSDSDLAPALDEVRRLDCAKVETTCWWDATTRRGYQVHPTDRSRPVWNTRLPEPVFRSVWDRTDYS